MRSAGDVRGTHVDEALQHAAGARGLRQREHVARPLDVDPARGGEVRVELDRCGAVDHTGRRRGERVVDRFSEAAALAADVGANPLDPLAVVGVHAEPCEHLGGAVGSPLAAILPDQQRQAGLRMILQKPLHQVGADKPGRAGHDDPFVGHGVQQTTRYASWSLIRAGSDANSSGWASVSRAMSARSFCRLLRRRVSSR